jgi:hypothetical protein
VGVDDAQPRLADGAQLGRADGPEAAGHVVEDAGQPVAAAHGRARDAQDHPVARDPGEVQRDRCPSSARAAHGSHGREAADVHALELLDAQPLLPEFLFVLLHRRLGVVAGALELEGHLRVAAG